MRPRRIGSTDIAAICGFYRPEMEHLTKRKNASDVYSRLVFGLDLPRSGPMGRGLRVEPVMRQLYRRDVGPCSGEPGVLQHPSREWATGSPDAFAEPSIVVEFKTQSVWAAKQWGDGGDAVPDAYALQCCWLMGVTDRDVSHVLVAFGVDGEDEHGEDDFSIHETRIFELFRDRELEVGLLALGQRFMDEHVTPRRPPELKPRANVRAWKRLINGNAALVG